MRLNEYPPRGSLKWARATHASDERGVVCWLSANGHGMRRALTDPYAADAPDRGWDIDMYCHGCDKPICYDCRPRSTA